MFWGVVALLMVGLIYAWSVFAKSIGANFPEWTAAEISLTFTITIIMFCLGSLVTGIIVKKVKARVIMIISAFLFMSGFLLAASGASLITLYMGVGILCGMGAGLAYNAVISSISAWFPDKQGLISGILLMGFGISSFIAGKIFAWMAPADGTDLWRAAFRLFAIVICIVLIICSFFIIRPENTQGKKIIEYRPPAMEASPGEIIKMKTFWFTYFWAVVTTAAGLILVSQASGIASQVGENISNGSIATVVGLISIMNGLGRIFFGMIYDKKGYRLTMLGVMVVFVLSGILLLLALISKNYILIILGFIAGGFAYGGVPTTNSAVANDFFGRINYSVNFPLISSNMIIASFSSTIAGKLYDTSQSYISTILMMLVVTLAAFGLFLGIRRPEAGKSI